MLGGSMSAAREAFTWKGLKDQMFGRELPGSDPAEWRGIEPASLDLQGGWLVLPERIELSTSPLPRECSTTELRQRYPG
jgi:hypothetical protein